MFRKTVFKLPPVSKDEHQALAAQVESDSKRIKQLEEQLAALRQSIGGVLGREV